jgi:hypothetical protein
MRWVEIKRIVDSVEYFRFPARAIRRFLDTLTDNAIATRCEVTARRNQTVASGCAARRSGERKNAHDLALI